MRTRIQFVTLLMAFMSQYAWSIDSSQVYFQKGIEEKNAKRFLIASKYFEKATSFDAKFVQAHLENAFANIEMRRTDAAKAEFSKVLEFDPANSIAIQQLAELYFSYRQYSKAIEFALKCKGYSNADKIIGISYYQIEDYASSIKYLQNYISKNPKDAEAMYTMSRNYLDMEDYEKAVPFYRKAIELDDSRNGWMYEFGLLCYTNNDYSNAVKYFSLALEKGYPQSNDVFENLGYAYIYNGDFANGERLLLNVLSKKPGNKDILRDIAEVYYKKKMYDKSLEYCQKLLELNKNDGKALWQAGLCFQKKGQKDRGQQMCDKAIELDPSLGSMRQKNMMSAGL
jgi:tetratricopeptide (TPR) repeat protein